MWIVLILGLLVYFFLIKPFLQKRKAHNLYSYLAVPEEVKVLIDQEEVFELAELLVELELDRKYELAKLILDAIASKSFGFSRRVDRIEMKCG